MSLETAATLTKFWNGFEVDIQIIYLIKTYKYR